MATRALPKPDWKATFRRSLGRAGEIAGAAILALMAAFLALALANYTQTDPSGSTAASPDHIANWMGAPGAWVSDKVLGWFGLPALLLLPLLYVAARRLWLEVETAGEAESARWWRPLGLLLVAIVLLGTVLALVFDQTAVNLPAGPGGLAGLLGARAIEAIAGRFGDAARGWVTGGLALASLIAGMALAARVFAFDWRRFLTLPDFLHRTRGRGEDDIVPLPGRRAKKRNSAPVMADDEDGDDANPPRRAPDIPDPTDAPRRAAATTKPKQREMFAQYELPSIELLAPPRRKKRSSSTSWRSNAMRGCSKPCSTISTSRARSPRSAPGRWSPCTSSSLRRVSRRAASSGWPRTSRAT